MASLFECCAGEANGPLQGGAFKPAPRRLGLKIDASHDNCFITPERATREASQVSVPRRNRLLENRLEQIVRLRPGEMFAASPFQEELEAPVNQNFAPTFRFWELSTTRADNRWSNDWTSTGVATSPQCT